VASCRSRRGGVVHPGHARAGQLPLVPLLPGGVVELGGEGRLVRVVGHAGVPRLGPVHNEHVPGREEHGVGHHAGDPHGLLHPLGVGPLGLRPVALVVRG